MIKALQMIVLLSIESNLFFTNTVPEFTAVYDGRKNVVNIKWQHKDRGIKSNIIQRSSDNATWSDIALQTINQNTGTKTYVYADKQPAPGDNYYRLKCITVEEKAEYSLGIMVIIASAKYNWVMYPVPVTDMLTLQYKGAEIIKGVITVLIQNSSGKIITRVRSASLTSIIRIPVNNLGRGIYDVRIIVEDDIIWNQRFIK